MRNTLFAILAIALLATSACAQGGGPGGGKRQGPPKEAITACEGKSEGDKASFTSPRGDTVSGICEMRNGQLILHPDTPPKKQ